MPFFNMDNLLRVTTLIHPASRSRLANNKNYCCISKLIFAPGVHKKPENI